MSDASETLSSPHWYTFRLSVVRSSCTASDGDIIPFLDDCDCWFWDVHLEPGIRAMQLARRSEGCRFVMAMCRTYSALLENRLETMWTMALCVALRFVRFVNLIVGLEQSSFPLKTPRWMIFFLYLI